MKLLNNIHLYKERKKLIDQLLPYLRERGIKEESLKKLVREQELLTEVLTEHQKRIKGD